MNKQQLLEAMREIFNGLYDVRVESLSQEADVAYTHAVTTQIMQVAREIRQQHAQPPFVVLRAQLPGGEAVELRLTLDYRKEKVRT